MASRITSSSGTWLIGVLLTESMGDFHTKRWTTHFDVQSRCFFHWKVFITWWLLPVEVQVGTVSSPQFGLDLWCILLGQKLHAQGEICDLQRHVLPWDCSRAMSPWVPRHLPRCVQNITGFKNITVKRYVQILHQFVPKHQATELFFRPYFARIFPDQKR